MAAAVNPVIPTVGMKPAVNVTMVTGEGGQPVLYAELVIPPEALATLMNRPDTVDYNLNVLASAVHARLRQFVRDGKQEYHNLGGV